MIAPGDPRLCACGHPAGAHEHYRAGTDCGACGEAVCPAFAPAAAPGLRRFLLVAAGVPVAVLALLGAGVLLGAWAVYTLLVVVLVLGVFLMTGPEGR